MCCSNLLAVKLSALVFAALSYSFWHLEFATSAINLCEGQMRGASDKPEQQKYCLLEESLQRNTNLFGAVYLVTC